MLHSSAILMCIAVMISVMFTNRVCAQSSAHPDAKPVLPDNPYISFRDPWRWDLNAQLFLSSGNVIGDDPQIAGRNNSERVITTQWRPDHIELVYPVVREGSFYWSPNREVQVSIRLDDVEIGNMGSRNVQPNLDQRDAPAAGQNAPYTQKFVQGTFAEYTHWDSGSIPGMYRQLHLRHVSHIVSADTIFNDDLARKLPWPPKWSPEIAAYLTPVVESVGEPINKDANETIETLLKFWIGQDTDPRAGSQLDVVKFLTGKVIEYFTIRGQATEAARRTTSGGRSAFVVTSNNWGGFIVRPADAVAKAPQGSRHDLAVLLTSVLRSAGIPARSVICIDERIEDPLLNIVSLVEFAMYDPERDMSFWVPIDIDRVRVSGGRSSQFKRKWLYFGTHDELHNLIPIAYFFHPPARYRAFNLPMLYGIRSTGTKNTLPNYMIQSLLVDPMMTSITGSNASPKSD